LLALPPWHISEHWEGNGREDMMAKQEKVQRSGSRREQEHERMLEAALARPGVREVMKVYGEWWEKDRGLDSYRAVTKKPARVTTTNSSNIC